MPETPPSESTTVFIAVGASAGGLEALSTFLGALPLGLDACVIVAQHLAPRSKSLLTELLAKKSTWPVEIAANGTSLDAGTVHVIPPNMDARIENGRMKLTTAGNETRPKPSVDALFESLAADIGPRAVGVILSGTGSDGAAGLRAIRAAGGVVMVQDAASSKYDGMPRAAMDSGSAELVAAPDVLAASLVRILGTPRGVETPLSAPGLEQVLSVLRKRRGMDFSQYKRGTLGRRLEKRMRYLGVHDIAKYTARLDGDPAEAEALSREMLISVTHFFRDSDVFIALSSALADRLSRYPENREFRVWVAGCATGEEPYSLAMILLDTADSLARNIPFKIFATDVDEDALAFARTGIYTRESLSTIPVPYQTKFFEDRGTEKEVCKRLRDVVVFARQDVTQNPPFVKLDLVCCRNVLIYFTVPLQEKIFALFHYALLPDGLLLLGKSEIPTGENLNFKAEDRSARLFVRVSGSHLLPPAPVPTLGRTPVPLHAVGSPRNRNSQPTEGVSDAVSVAALELSGVSGALLDETGNIVRIIGNPQFLKFSAGVPDLRLSSLLPKEIAGELPALLRRTVESKKTAVGREHLIETSLGKRVLRMRVAKLSELNIAVVGNQLLATFEVKEPRRSRMYKPVPGQMEPPELENLAGRVFELEQELAASREHLNTVIQELSIANEEMQSLNEELSSSNEELQSSNEELETTNEEMQSINEELTTLNEELHVKSSELKQLNASLENIQSSIGSPMLVIDSQLRLLRYNSLATQIFQLSPASLNQPLTKASCLCEIPGFENALAATVRTGIIEEIRVNAGRQLYQLRIMPCREEPSQLTGAILVFFDNTDVIAAEDKLRMSEARVRSIIDGVPALVALKDPNGRYVLVNRAFQNRLALSEAAILGKSDRELFSRDVATKLRDADLEVLFLKQPVEREERLTFGGRERVYVSSRSPLFDGEVANGLPAVAIVLVDITELWDAKEAMRESEARYRAMVEEQAVFVCRHTLDGVITYHNAAFAEYFGGNNSDLTGTSFFSLLVPAEVSAFKQSTAALTIQNPVTQQNICHPRLAAARPTWVRWVHRLLPMGANSPAQFQAVGFDVTETHLQTAALSQRESLFSSILNFSSDFVQVFRINGSDFLLESMNLSAERDLGLVGTPLIGRTLADLVPQESIALTVARFRACVGEHKAVQWEEEVRMAGGQMRYFHVTLIPIVESISGLVTRVASLSRDISHHKAVEIQLRDSQLASESASRAKSDFLATMSHELRTPLNVILGMSELLESNLAESEELRFVESIRRAGRMLLALVDDILDLSKIEAGKVTLNRVSFPLMNLVHDLVQGFRPQAEAKGIALVVAAQEVEKLTVLGDELRIKQILANFISNAIKFTSEGCVTIKITNQADPSGFLTNLFFEVDDTGMGIPRSSHARLFQRFSQVDGGLSRKFGGSGLGLAICKQLVELMGGVIGFESEAGAGSHFWFRVQLPRIFSEGNMALSSKNSVGKQQSQAQKEIAVGASGEGGLKVLAVDDNQESHALLHEFLWRMGHHPTIVGGGVEALELLQRGTNAAAPQAFFDLILMDVQMPDLDGLETTRRIRELGGHWAKIPVVALTANVQAGQREQCLLAGMNEFITKPIAFQPLQACLSQWVVPATYKSPEQGLSSEETAL